MSVAMGRSPRFKWRVGPDLVWTKQPLRLFVKCIFSPQCVVGRRYQCGSFYDITFASLRSEIWRLSELLKSETAILNSLSPCQFTIGEQPGRDLASSS